MNQTSRLLPGFRINDFEVSIQYYHKQNDPDGRVIYEYFINVGKNEYRAHDLKSGVQGGNLQEGLSGLISLLTAAAESYRYAMRLRIPLSETENGTIFPEWLVEEAYQVSDELSNHYHY